MFFLFVSLVSCSLIWTALNKDLSHVPPMKPDNPGEVDATFGYLVSFLILPLLSVTEDRKDYSIEGSPSP